MNMAAADNIVHRLLPSITQLVQALQKKSDELMPVVKSGRTHLHDAIPMRLGQEFLGYAGTIQAVLKKIEKNLDELYEIGLGGNAIGTLYNLDTQYIPKIMKEICQRTNLPFRESDNLFRFMQNPCAAIGMMLSLKELAIHLIKITSDLRLLSSGPRTGFSEITLPSVQPGSTIMPGKVNPAILEMVHMVCCQVIGYEAAIAAAGVAGQLEINVMMPVIAYTLLQAIELLSNALPILVTKCIEGIEANEERCKQLMEASLALVTGLSPSMGYDLASQIGMQADEENKTLEQVLQEKGLLTEETGKALDPNGML
jgi:fumarate hydratase class II